MQAQVIFVHGGTVWRNDEDFYSYLRKKEVDRVKTNDYWSYWLKHELSDVEFFLPQMPNKRNADYTAWKIWFEKYLQFIEDDTTFILIGHSLGASFLAKYLSETKLPKRADAIYLVSLPLFEDELDDEILGTFVADPANLSRIQSQCQKTVLYHSEDDWLVPISDSEFFVSKVPSATLTRFTDRGHIHQETFPELLEEIRKIL